MAKANCEHECRSDRLGLSDAQRGALTGFTYRVFSALAHLTSAWSIADATNVRAVEQGIAALLEARSIRECRSLVLEALSANLASDQSPHLLMAVGLASPLHRESVPREGSAVAAVCGVCCFRKLDPSDGPVGTTVCRPCQQAHGMDHQGRG